MTLRIIDADGPFLTAFMQLEATLAAWGGRRGDAWERADGLEGWSFSRSDEVYLFIERQRRRYVFGAALSAGDRDLLTFEISRDEPARDKKRVAAAMNETGECFLLIAAEALKSKGIGDVFRRLAGAPAVKRANLAERDYVLIGPLTDPRSAEALLALAALHPRFERQIEKSAHAAVDEDREDMAIYAVSHEVAKTHRAAAKATRALFERLAALGYYAETVELGALKADLAMSRGEDTVVFEIRAEAEIEDLQRALGHLALIAPLALGLTRVIVLPAPKGALGATLDPYKQAFEEMKVSLVFYDFKGGATVLTLDTADPGLHEDVQLALA
jgi:hypothetical protein